MNRDLWEFNQPGEAGTDNDANDYFYEWATLNAGDMNIVKLFNKFLNAGYGSEKVRVKARKGAIFIVVEGDKDDTPNPRE